MLFHLLWELRHEASWLSWLRVIRYVSTRSIVGFVTAFILCVVVTPAFIRAMQRLKVGQNIRDDGPESHLMKAGTPTMGGAVIIGSLAISALLWCDLRSPYVWLVLGVTVAYGAIGFIDDYLKMVRGSSKGLSVRVKLGGQIVVGLAAVWYLYQGPVFADGMRLSLSLPFVDFYRHPLELPFIVYATFGLLVLVGSSNAVNLTDGLDGLAIFPVIVAAGAFVILAWVAGTVLFYPGMTEGFNIARYLRVPHIPGAGELAVFAASMAAASIGFLWHNTYPASIFMGDVGSLGLGAGLGMIALTTKNELVWALLGGVFVVETISVMAQVGSFKLTGRRIFRMAPLHHHYELKGWEEPKIVVRAWVVSLLLAMAALGTLKLR